MSRIATIDIGTNTALLLIADVASDGSLHVVYDEERFVRLGEGVDATRRINPAALERLRKTLVDYRATAEALLEACYAGFGLESREIQLHQKSRVRLFASLRVPEVDMKDNNPYLNPTELDEMADRAGD